MEEIKEIGEEGYKHFKKTLKFGDVIENGWASDRNPNKFGMVVKISSKTIECTDGAGKFWKLCFDYETKIKTHGNAIQSNEDYKGSTFSKPTTDITLGCISPEARELLDIIMQEWEKHYEDMKDNITTATSGEQTEPSIYMFAYWLVRWSGLIQPVSQNENDGENK